MKKKVSWHEDAKNWDYDKFKKFHSYLFIDEFEMKQAYQDCISTRGKSPIILKEDNV
jgi:hypothetical protein